MNQILEIVTCVFIVAIDLHVGASLAEAKYPGGSRDDGRAGRQPDGRWGAVQTASVGLRGMTPEKPNFHHVQTPG